MKFTLALLAATAAALSNSENPFEGLPEKDYEQLITVDPKIAPETGRPDCLDGKCHLKNAAGADKTFLAVDYSGAVAKAFLPVDKPPFNAYLSNHPITEPTAVTLYGYAGINLNVTQGGTADLLALVKEWNSDIKLILTLHFADYKKLVGEDNQTLKDNVQRLFVFTSANDHDQGRLADEEQTITWIVKDDGEGQALYEKTQAANIVTLNESDYAINDFANGRAICAP